MDIKKRKTVIAGNWKMNKTSAEAAEFISALIPLIPDGICADVVLCVPFTDIQTALKAVEGTSIGIGAQNVHFEPKGAYTGEISAAMLTSAGVQYVIVGHSERRQYFGETDTTVNKRLTAALDAGLTVILCVGETLPERESNITNSVVGWQTQIALTGVDAAKLSRVIIAYEPVWAIGTGLTATPEDADEVCGFIRSVIAQKYGCDAAEAFTVQYGGSMNEKNAAELLAKPNIDGGLIGGASLDPAKFAEVVRGTMGCGTFLEESTKEL